MRTVKEVSKLTGVSVRTLHYYDAIGLLEPTKVTDAGYRMYDDTALSRLQNILLFRELQFPLKEIKEILDKMILGCVPQKNMKLVSELIRNETFHYVELKHKSVVKDKLWVLGEEIKQCNLIEITYWKKVSAAESFWQVLRQSERHFR